MTVAEAVTAASERRSVEPLLRTEALALYYDGKAAFRDVSLDVEAGRITALIGPSGCGKTSFLSCLNRLSDLLFILARYEDRALPFEVVTGRRG